MPCEMGLFDTNIEFFYSPASPPCRSVMFAIKALKLDVDYKKIDIFKKAEQTQPWFIRVSPCGFPCNKLSLDPFEEAHHVGELEHNNRDPFAFHPLSDSSTEGGLCIKSEAKRAGHFIDGLRDWSQTDTPKTHTRDLHEFPSPERSHEDRLLEFDGVATLGRDVH